MFMVISFWADFGRPVLASLLGKTGGGAKTHRCPEDFFFLIDFSGDDYRIYRGFKNIHIGWSIRSTANSSQHVPDPLLPGKELPTFKFALEQSKGKAVASARQPPSRSYLSPRVFQAFQCAWNRV
jgi:hypothetical protein